MQICPDSIHQRAGLVEVNSKGELCIHLGGQTWIPSEKERVELRKLLGVDTKADPLKEAWVKRLSSIMSDRPAALTNSPSIEDVAAIAMQGDLDMQGDVPFCDIEGIFEIVKTAIASRQYEITILTPQGLRQIPQQLCTPAVFCGVGDVVIVDVSAGPARDVWKYRFRPYTSIMAEDCNRIFALQQKHMAAYLSGYTKRRVITHGVSLSDRPNLLVTPGIYKILDRKAVDIVVRLYVEGSESDGWIFAEVPHYVVENMGGLDQYTHIGCAKLDSADPCLNYCYYLLKPEDLTPQAKNILTSTERVVVKR